MKERKGDPNYFRKDNKELILDNRLFSERIYKQKDVAFLKNPFHNLVRKNALVSERLNQRKNKLRLLTLNINSISVTEHPLFIDEDREMVRLREKMKIYNQLVNLALVPYYGELEQVLNKELGPSDSMQKEPKSKQEINKIIKA